MAAVTAPWRKVGDAVQDRRIHLGLTQAQLAAHAGVSESTVRMVERAGQQSYQRSKLLGLCRALGWTPDSIERILRGDDPIDAESRPAGHRPVREELDRLQAELDRLKARLAEEPDPDPQPS